MSERPVTGPFPITVEPIPAGATLDIEKYVRTAVSDIVDALLGDEFGDRLDEIREAAPSDPHAVQRPADLLFESLVDALTSEIGTKLPVYGEQLARLTGALHREYLRMSSDRHSSLREGGAAA